MLRRVGATVGMVFGFGLLALLMAGTANAEDSPRGDDGAQPHAERSLLGGLSLDNLLSPITEAVTPVLDSVVQTATPVLNVVTPVVAPVTEPVVGRLPHPAAPVSEPAPNAVVPLDEVVDGTTPVSAGTQELVVSQETSPPLWVDDAGTTPVPPPLVRAASAPVALVDLAAVDRSDQPGHAPGVPVGPAGVAPGGGGSVGGSGGSHGAELAVSPPSSSLPGEDSGGRGPPGTVTCHSWIGYDQPDCPS